RPIRHGATITFAMAGPSKLTISRPGDHFADADILFLFANPPDHSRITSETPGVRYYAPGVHRENIDAHSGDTIYLAGGAVVFGSLNIWQVHNVRVLGTGVIIYDGPQDPHSDEGWMHKPNWHVIVMDNAHDIEIDGITCITRSRSWQIQMRDSHHIGFYNIKAIGGNPNDANQDGMDWLGGGDTTVRNSFFRASDDVFALQGNWDGYQLALMRVPGHNVSNITIEDTIASTSISNTIRVGWPQKTFNSAHFHMSNVDVINTGFGSCKVPFAFFELWADPNGHGTHTDYTFRNIRLEDWYSLFQIRQPNPGVRDISFQDIWALDGPAMVPSVLKGDVSGVKLRGVPLQGYLNAVPQVEDGAAQPEITPAAIDAHFTYTSGYLKPGRRITFTADLPTLKNRRFEWIFGDGSRAEGRQVHHAFPDAKGTLLDGTGRFRVLLHIVDAQGEQGWSSQSLVLSSATKFLPAKSSGDIAVAKSLSSSSGSGVFERLLHIPADGGYTFTLLTSTDATITIDDLAPHHTPKPRALVCGSTGDAVQPVRVSAVLSAGDHRIRIERHAGVENAAALPGAPADQPVLLWEGPGIDREPIPQSIYSPTAP
ncbi:MAG: PKD domain-containing protein, partial [Edaphobacter sp.]